MTATTTNSDATETPNVPQHGDRPTMTTTTETNNDATETPDVPREAGLYRAADIAICRLDPGVRATTRRGWTTRSAEPDEFLPGEQIGIVCGWLSKGSRKDRYLV